MDVRYLGIKPMSTESIDYNLCYSLYSFPLLKYVIIHFFQPRCVLRKPVEEITNQYYMAFVLTSRLATKVLADVFPMDIAGITQASRDFIIIMLGICHIGK